MFYCLCENHNCMYEIYEILSLYFPGEKLTTCESKESIPENCKLILSKVRVDSNINVDCTLIEIKDGIHYEQGTASSSIPIEDNLKKSIKHGVKASTFKLLKYITKAEIPWGILVGIRPTKIVNNLKVQNKSDIEITSILKDKYLIRDDKIQLVKTVSNNSYDIINHDKRNISIYIGIPFCPTRCIYCSFASYPMSKYSSYVEKYIESLKWEISQISGLINKHFKIETIYIGGGTPTSLSADLFNSLLQTIALCFDLKAVKEFTIEAGRPDTIDKTKLDMMKSYGVTRISINPQSMNDDTLKKVGREHSVQDTYDKFIMAREAGFFNINMDIILGLPGETKKHVEKTVKGILQLSPENITVHTMAIKRASILHENIIDKMYTSMPEGSMVNSMMDYAQSEFLKEYYYPYYMYRQKMMVGNLENVSYCKKGFECIYNIQMIEERETIIGMGVDAVTKLVFLDENRIERHANKKNIDEYINTIELSTEKKIAALSVLT